jgi:hypothetical protein
MWTSPAQAGFGGDRQMTAPTGSWLSGGSACFFNKAVVIS